MSRPVFVTVVVVEVALAMVLYEAGLPFLALLMVGVGAVTGAWFRSTT